MKPRLLWWERLYYWVLMSQLLAYCSISSFLVAYGEKSWSLVVCCVTVCVLLQLSCWHSDVCIRVAKQAREEATGNSFQ